MNPLLCFRGDMPWHSYPLPSFLLDRLPFGDLDQSTMSLHSVKDHLSEASFIYIHQLFTSSTWIEYSIQSLQSLSCFLIIPLTHTLHRRLRLHPRSYINIFSPSYKLIHGFFSLSSRSCFDFSLLLSPRLARKWQSQP